MFCKSHQLIKPKQYYSNSCNNLYQNQNQNRQKFTVPQSHMNNNSAYYINKFNQNQSNQSTSSYRNSNDHLRKFTGFRDITQPLPYNPKKLTLINDTDVINRSNNNISNNYSNVSRKKTSECTENHLDNIVVECLVLDNFVNKQPGNQMISESPSVINETNKEYVNVDSDTDGEDDEVIIIKSNESINLANAFNKKLKKSYKRVHFVDIAYDIDHELCKIQENNANKTIKLISDQKNEEIYREKLKAINSDLDNNKLLSLRIKNDESDKQKPKYKFEPTKLPINHECNINNKTINSRYVFLDKNTSYLAPKRQGFLNVIKCLQQSDSVHRR